MKPISYFVENYIKSRPFLQNALADGIINLSSLARTILPDIKKHAKKDIQEGAIVMALKRLSPIIEFEISRNILQVIQKVQEITVRSQISDYGFLISDTILENQVSFLNSIKKSKDVFYTSSRGTRELNIVVSNNIDELVEHTFSRETCVQKLENLSAVSIKLPKENTVVPGIYYFIFQRLAWEGIIINEVISTSNEFTILINENQVKDAFSIMNNLKSVLRFNP